MKYNVLAFAVPLFTSFMILEYLVARWKNKNYFSFNHSITSINTGIGERLADIFWIGVSYFIYDYLHTHFALFEIPKNLLTWFLLLMLTDLVWYWYHRLGHEVNLLWAVHVVHHQSEDYNFTAAARVTVIQSMVRTCFWAVMPIVGFPAEMIAKVLLVHGIYSFFLHTRFIGKLGFLEHILVTPSHHRVHHAVNPQYLDKNYSDIFIIWDKMFGTFAEEKEEPRYGITKPVEKNGFLWQHFHFMIDVAKAFIHTPRFSNKMQVLFGRPDDLAQYLETPKTPPAPANKTLGGGLKTYVIAQVLFTLVASFFLLYFEFYLSKTFIIWTVTVLFATMINTNLLLDTKKINLGVELLRIMLLAATLWAYYTMNIVI